MLCTVIWDVYRSDERRDVLSAMQTLFRLGGADWSRKGVYAYWDPEIHELLYVGLATDLADRFAQHNGLIAHGGGNKFELIDAWFAGHETLGTTLLLQAAAVELLDVLYGLSPTLGVEASSISQIAEGQLIELHRLERGRRPPWNKVGGSTLGAEWARPSGRSVIRLLSAAEDSLFVARRTLRSLVSDGDAMRFEAVVHAARMRALMDEHEVTTASDIDSPALVEEITRFLMLRDGKLVDDLGDLDVNIRTWVEHLADMALVEEEQQRVLRELRELAAAAALEEDQSALAFIARMVDVGTDPETAQAASRLLRNGYLDQAPELLR